jgi:hypothetical protein
MKEKDGGGGGGIGIHSGNLVRFFEEFGAVHAQSVTIFDQINERKVKQKQRDDKTTSSRNT